MKEKEFITLAQLQQIVKDGVEATVPKSIWVSGEITEIKENYSGHCYLELAEYDKNAQLVAKVKAIIWASVYRAIKPYFFEVTGSALTAGMHVLVRVQVQYSVVYGLSLIIDDIDPKFLIGDLELKKQETILRLKNEGLIDMNKELGLPLLPRKFAVISAINAAGYRDFIQHLHNNNYGFKFSTYLFPSPMQGAEASMGIVMALEKIYEYNSKLLLEKQLGFDAVVIIRGGGSIMDLSVFDDYEIVAHIAQFPLPVITGIGHDHDFHIADMVANTYLKTPTAVADFILDIFASEYSMLDSLCSRFRLAAFNKLSEAQTQLLLLKSKFKEIVSGKIKDEETKLAVYEQKIKLADPSLRLNVGESIIEVDGKKCEGITSFKNGSNVLIYMSDGFVSFKISDVVKKKNSKK